jgi:hypothetical protein
VSAFANCGRTVANVEVVRLRAQVLLPRRGSLGWRPVGGPPAALVTPKRCALAVLSSEVQLRCYQAA